MENLHIDYYDITSYHSGFDQTMTPVALFCFLQESAWRHASSKGYGWHDLKEKQQFWILAKVHAVIHRIPCWTEQIRLETWGKQPELLTAFRDFELFDAQNTLVVSATSSWHILDIQNRKPVAMDDFMDKFPIISNRHAMKQKAKKIRLPIVNPCKGDLFSVQSGDIDMNQHVNNTKYIQWAMDAVPFDFQQAHSLREISVNFVSESRIGEQCYLNTYQEDTVFSQAVICSKDQHLLSLLQSKWISTENQIETDK
jgi:acyl-ACP thioesterase